MHELHGFGPQRALDSAHQLHRPHSPGLQPLPRTGNPACIKASKLFNCKPLNLRNVILWGNHSRRQYCDVTKLEIEGLSAEFISEKIKELNLASVQKIMYERGGFILEKSNGNAYISATKAIFDHLKDWYQGSDRIVSMGVVLES